MVAPPLPTFHGLSFASFPSSRSQLLDHDLPFTSSGLRPLVHDLPFAAYNTRRRDFPFLAHSGVSSLSPSSSYSGNDGGTMAAQR
ncbi:glycerol-3-phosphate dehydrogenase [Sesbania bispinosa]|nr:glycerol-3-phosphate dehydrogenase [Sesbania bispinosa]